MYAFLPVPAIIPTSELPNISPEAAAFRDRIIASMDIALNGLRILASDLNKAENQTEKALTNDEAESLTEAMYGLFAAVINGMTDEDLPLFILQQSALESRTFPEIPFSRD